MNLQKLQYTGFDEIEPFLVKFTLYIWCITFIALQTTVES